MVDLKVRDALERLPMPPEPPAFLDDLWREAEVRERRAARSWRRVTVALVATLLAAAGAAGIFAALSRASAFDQTLTCRTGGSAIWLTANPTEAGTPDPSKPFAASVLLQISGTASLLAFDTTHKNYVLNTSACSKAARSIPLSASGLPQAGVYHGGSFVGFRTRCDLAGPLVFRIQLQRNGDGIPTSALLSVRATKHGVPIAFVKWTPQRVVAYRSSRCE